MVLDGIDVVLVQRYGAVGEAVRSWPGQNLVDVDSQFFCEREPSHYERSVPVGILLAGGPMELHLLTA